MIQIQMLESSDIIRPNDLVRPLSLSFQGQSDYLETNSTYGGSPVNRLGWIYAKYNNPYWVGKTVGEFNSEMERFGVQYEFIRGPVPLSHLEKLTPQEIKSLEMTWAYFTTTIE